MACKYVYGIIMGNGESSFGPIGLGHGSREVYTVVHQALGCVISDYQGPGFHVMAKEELMRCLVVHQVVIETVMRRRTVLPAKFGTLLEDSVQVQRFLQQGYAQLNDALHQIQDQVEVEVAATWDMGKVLQEIGNEEEIVRLKEQVVGRPAEETLEQRIQVGKRVKELLDRRRDSYRERMIDFLKDTALDLQPNALLSDEMVLNVAFLIHKAKQEDFDDRVKELDRGFHDEINFRIIGPLPPYSFSTVEVMRPSTDKLEEARKLLGLGEAVSEAEVKQAYRRLGAKIHPDRNPGDQQAEERFAKLRQASTLLLAFCRGQGGTRHAKGESHLLTPRAIKDTFVISIRRPALGDGEESAWVQKW